MRARLLGTGLVVLALMGTALVGACGDKKGALILAITTDMKAPKDVNAVSVTVSTNGAIKHSFIGRVTPDGDVLLPATLAIVQPDDASATVRVRVVAFQERKPRVLRDVRTTVPRDGRTGLLRIPLNFVDDGSAMGEPLPDGVLPPAGGGSGGSGAADFDFFGSFQPPCADIQNQTVIDGDCRDNAVDPAALPDYDDTLVFGAGKDGADVNGCFEVATCLAGATVLSGDRLDTTTCAVNGVADPSKLNLAIVTSDTGECLKDGDCYVPLDQGASGWHVESGRVQLPPFVCKLLGKGLRLFASTGACKAKSEAQPICRPAPKNATPAGAPLQCLSACGSCVAQHCDRNAVAQCFGPDWDKGMVTGPCSDLYQCACGCGTDLQTCKCDAAQGSACQACLTQNINTCADANCKTSCMMGGNQGAPDAGPVVGSTSVHLTLTPNDPPPVPSPGATFDATMGGFFKPVPLDSAVSANSTSSPSTFKVEWCTGTLTQGKTFTHFSTGPGCTNGEPFVDFETSAGVSGHFVSGLGAAGQQGTMVVQNLNPLTLVFQGLRLDADTTGKATGTFSVQGQGTWFGVNGAAQ